MTLAGLAWRYLWARPLVAALNLLMLALGFGAMVFVTLVAEQLEHQTQRDLAGIDLVVGAKGSPLQMILAGVFQVDVPTGNIPLATVAQLREHPLAASVVPLSMGDAVQGFRIVGTEPAYLDLYGARLAQGRLWAKPLEAVLGAGVAESARLGIGQSFAGTHGLGKDGDDLRKALQEQRFREKVQFSQSEARRAGLAGTPTLYVNGRRHLIPDFSDTILDFTLDDEEEWTRSGGWRD